MKNINIFIGIDQTGAVQKNGLPKPLNVCIIDQRKKLIVKNGLYISSLTQVNIKNLLITELKNYNNEPVLICVDTVFGLPVELNIKVQKILKTSENYSFKEKKYGALTAHHFFNSFLKVTKTKVLPQRRVDQIVNSNSVFNLAPYQKNIGCGSYRIIKDLASEKKWFNLWPFESKNCQFYIAEGYPTFFWKNLLNLKSRNLEELKNFFPKLTFKNLDQADSFLLAFGASKCEKYLFKTPTKAAKKEGWILGVPFE